MDTKKKEKKDYSKVNKILFTETLSKHYYPYQNWYFPLKRACNQIISFDTRWNYFAYGKKIMNQKLLQVIEKEQPDYMFMWVKCDEFYLDTFFKIRRISPKTQIMLFFGDDDSQFEGFSRYYILFLDYGLIAQKKYVDYYKRDGIKNVFFTMGLDTGFFKPLNIEKKYDVTFIGAPKSKFTGRSELVKFLKYNEIKIRLFGLGWNKFPNLKDVYDGPLDSDKMVEVLNQSKINLCFSKEYGGGVHLKGKFFEGSACKSFVLTEYCKEYSDMFKEGKEIIMFRDKNDMLQKVKYYLKNDKKREEIAENAYKKVVKTYGLDSDLKKIFKKIKNNVQPKKLPKIDKKIVSISDKKINLTKKELEEKLSNCDYVFFTQGWSQSLKYRKYLQAYSLYITKKDISCCDYYLYTKTLGDYLRFSPESGFKTISKEKFIYLLNINQLMITKNYFLENLQLFKDIFNGRKIDFVTKENTTFVSFPLVRINKFADYDCETIRYSTEFKFLFILYSLLHRKKLFLGRYLIALLFEAIKDKKFIFEAVFSILKDKDKQDKINDLKKSNSD